jgi:hypothetical protein
LTRLLHATGCWLRAASARGRFITEPPSLRHDKESRSRLSLWVHLHDPSWRSGRSCRRPASSPEGARKVQPFTGRGESRHQGALGRDDAPFFCLPFLPHVEAKNDIFGRLTHLCRHGEDGYLPLRVGRNLSAGRGGRGKAHGDSPQTSSSRDGPYQRRNAEESSLCIVPSIE